MLFKFIPSILQLAALIVVVWGVEIDDPKAIKNIVPSNRQTIISVAGWLKTGNVGKILKVRPEKLRVQDNKQIADVVYSTMRDVRSKEAECHKSGNEKKNECYYIDYIDLEEIDIHSGECRVVLEMTTSSYEQTPKVVIEDFISKINENESTLEINLKSSTKASVSEGPITGEASSEISVGTKIRQLTRREASRRVTTTMEGKSCFAQMAALKSVCNLKINVGYNDNRWKWGHWKKEIWPVKLVTMVNSGGKDLILDSCVEEKDLLTSSRDVNRTLRKIN
ncbi:uncharacterized protein VTP21DRAFT_4281 [Calcarisporiella thermophila]|uniref:uncharacterized protein n=1 Tax=Calcarisporiella thermophila TaxID=911321 RepID=UPI003743E8C6